MNHLLDVPFCLSWLYEKPGHILCSGLYALRKEPVLKLRSLFHARREKQIINLVKLQCPVSLGNFSSECSKALLIPRESRDEDACHSRIFCKKHFLILFDCGKKTLFTLTILLCLHHYIFMKLEMQHKGNDMVQHLMTGQFTQYMML